MRLIVLAGLVVVLGMAGSSSAADDPPLSLADLEAYRVALSSPDQSTAPTVTFRDLWDHAEARQGKRVRVEGRVARLFRQPKLGEFPPLTEAWVVNPAGDPFCLVFPSEASAERPNVGETVAFTGTFLRRIPYRGGDFARLAPLIVGPSGAFAGQAGTLTPGFDHRTADWAFGGIAASAVILILARRHVSRPPSRPTTYEPAPTFSDSDDSRPFEEEGSSHESR